MYNFFKRNGKEITPINEVLLIPEFKEIWERDNTESKSRALNDFAIIYFGGYFNSPMNIYGDKKWNKIAEKFKNDSGWRPKDDKKIEAALKVYEELQDTPSLRILKSIRESLETSDAVISQVSKNIRTIAKKQNEEEDDKKALQNMEKLFNYISKLLNIQGKIPESINSVVDLETKVFDELSQKKIRGGGTVGTRENPNRDGRY